MHEIRDQAVVSLQAGYEVGKRNAATTSALENVIRTLAAGEELDKKYRDHLLLGDYAGFHECHITPDWLLIYQIHEEELYLLLSRTGSHSDLF